jgi:hypothetical protein
MMTHFLPAFFACTFIGNAVQAEIQRYDLLLGQRQLGTLSFDTDTLDLEMDLDNTPFGIADGYFNAQSGPIRTPEGISVTQYLSQSAKRQISFVMDESKVLATTISPTREATTLSEPEAVPAGVIPLTEGFAAIATVGSCPTPFTMYDGRRVVQVATRAQSTNNTDIQCEMDYHVTAGPGHLSPFRFSTLDMALIYRDSTLELMKVKAGGFELQVVRQ